MDGGLCSAIIPFRYKDIIPECYGCVKIPIILDIFVGL
jgi:hypothetical protein